MTTAAVVVRRRRSPSPGVSSSAIFVALVTAAPALLSILSLAFRDVVVGGGFFFPKVEAFSPPAASSSSTSRCCPRRSTAPVVERRRRRFGKIHGGFSSSAAATCRLASSSSSSENDDDDDFNLDDDDFFADDSELIFAATSAASLRIDEDARFDRDLSGCTVRRFSLGYDLLLDSFVGSMGFDEVTDWDYYAIDVDEEGNRDSRGGNKEKVTPNPLDPNQPRRTRERSGGVVRVFRGDLGGARLGSALRARGMDARVLVKEYSGAMGETLAGAELRAAARMQSELIRNTGGLNELGGATRGAWGASGADRFVEGRTEGRTPEDDANLIRLLSLMSGGTSASSSSKVRSPHVGVLGVLDLTDYLSDPDPDASNEWYRALKVAPPKPGSIWIVYEYAGLNTLAGYARPPAERVAAMPPRRGIFGELRAPPPLPQWRDRANYVVRGILKGALESLARLHEAGLVHRSIGRSSIILGSIGQDKAEGGDAYSTVVARLVVKISDLGFSAPIREVHSDGRFRARARSFDVTGVNEYGSTPEARHYAVAEDLHALGFVFLGTLLTSLAVAPVPGTRLPNTDEDGLQRLLGDIFDGSFEEFREYVKDEGEVWRNVVELLDEEDGAGWELLEDMCRAREKVSELGEGDVGTTARSLLDNPIFSRR